MGGKATYEDTDNRKREFTGTTKPGVVEVSPGIRVEENQSWEEGRSLVLYPSWKSKRSMSLDANMGWIEKQPNSDFETAQKRRKEKPQLQFTKYQVSKKTGDIIPDSEVNIDMAYPSLGLSRAQRRKKNNYISNPKMEFKAGLPGRSLESRVPGGNLLARAAGRFGIMRDAANKFRCPPGTPAANQFTDHLGSNCFGISAERAAKFIAEKISDLMKVNDESLSLSSGAKSTWRERLGIARPDVEIPGRSPSYDMETGERIPTTPAEIVDVPGRLRWFKNATVNAQRNLARSESVIQKLESRMVTGDFTPEQREVNTDRHALLSILKNRGIWDIEIKGRLSEKQVDEFVKSRLESIPEWGSLTDDEKTALITADKKRFYETERAMLDSLLEQFVIRPEHMRTVGKVEFFQEPIDKDNSEATTSWDVKSEGAGIKSVINVNIEQIMENQESLIPNMSPSERLVISAVGAKTDAEATARVADFLINTEYTARGMAGLIDGPRSFSRHIMLHEIGHTIQGEAFLKSIQQQIDAYGYVDVPVYDYKKGKFTGATKQVSDIRKLTGGDLAVLVVGSQDDINLTSLDSAMSKIENVAFLAGSYPQGARRDGRMEVYALEATTELWALREEGIIFGDDIDDALGFMDDAIGAKASEFRAVTDMEMLEKLEESYFSPYEKGEDVLPIRQYLRTGIELDKKAIAIKREERELAAHKKEIKDLDQNGLAEKLADTIFEIELRTDILRSLQKERIDAEKSGLPLESIDEEIERIKSPLRLLDEKKKREIAKNRDFNSDGKSKSDKEITDMAIELNKAKKPLTKEMVERRDTEARIDLLRSEAEALDEKSLMKTIADYDLRASSLKPDSDEYITAIADREIFVQQYIENKKAAGDTRSGLAIKNELKKEITKEITASRKAVDEAKRGKLKPQKMKSKEQIAQNAKKERAKLRRNITKQQFEAVKEIDDFNAAEITQMLEPDKQVAVGRAINKRNNRLKRLGLESDPSSVDEGSLDEQVENILIPAMEAIDSSDITTPFEMEVFLDSSKLSRVKPGKEIDVDSFGQGKVLSRSMKPGKPEKGSKKKRVVVQVKEGDRGLFPLAKKGDEQQFVIPPGKLRVVGRDKDGSLIVEISSQKDTVDVLDDLSKSIGDGPGDAIWRQGAKKKIQLVADRHAVKRKDDAVGTKSDDAAKVTETSESIVAEVSELGGEFGETISASLSSGARDTTESLRTKRHEKYSEVIGRPGERSESLKSAIAALMDEDRNLAASVEEILDNESNEQIIDRIETAAQKLHSGFDRRVRVRMGEDEISNLSESGKVRAFGLSSGAATGDGETRRTGRLSRRVEEFRDRTEQKTAAIGATEEFKKLREAGLGNGGLDRLNDETLKRKHGLERSGQKSVLSDNPIYRTDSAEQAIALLALGYEVEVIDDGERKMVKNAAIQTEEELKKFAADEAKRLGIPDSDTDRFVNAFMETHDIDLCALYNSNTNVFCSEHLDVRREHMPQSEGAAKNANSPALRALVSGHVAGKYSPKSGLSDEDVNRYKEITKKLGNPKKFSEVSEEDKQWAFSNTNWSKVEPNTAPELMQFLKNVLPGGEQSVVSKSKSPDLLKASQKQLRNSQIDSQSQNILDEYNAARETWGVEGSPEFNEKRAEFLDKAWFQSPILTSNDGYVVDGHHRWAAIKMFNDHVPEAERIEVQVNELQTSIFESIILAKVFQEHMEIKGKTVGKVKPFVDGETNPMSKAEFDEHIKKAQDSVQELGKKIKDDGLYPFTVQGVIPKEEERSPGLKANRDRSVKEYGMTWKPEYSKVKSVEESKTWDGWDDVEVTEVDLSSDILPTESHLKGESIDKVVSGSEPLREGYFVNLVIDQDGKMYVSDGHNRVAMNRALGNEKIQARIVDLRRVEAPWGEQSSGKTTYKGYDLVEPSNPLPEPGKYPDDVVDAATAQREKVETVEKEITSTLIDLSEKHGSVMIGLAARLKNVKSLSRKINDERGNRTAEETAADMSDIARYTMTYTPENYVSGTKAVVADLQAAGYRLKVKNYWEAGDAYQGINVAAVHPDGTRFELQFHTPQSAFKKEEVHSILDDYRLEKDPVERWILYDKMVKMSASIDIPVEDGLLDIGESRSQDFSLALSSGAESVKPEASIRQSGATKKTNIDAAQKESNTGRSIGKNRNKKEVSKKDAAAEWFSAFKGFDSPDFGKNKDEYARTKKYYESVGLNADIREDLMPVSGYLVHKSHIQKKKNEVIKNRVGNVGPDAVFEIQDNDPVGDGLTSLGDVEIVLKPEVSKRTSYGRGSGIKNGHRPVSMSSTSKDDISHAVSYSGSDSDSDAMVNLLASSVDGDFSRMSRNSKTNGNENFEAHILGGFDADEVDSINYPYSKLSKMSEKEDISDVVNNESIADSLRDMGFTQEEIDYFYSVGGPGQINTESMAKLREYRMSKKVKDKYSKLGFSKVKIAHPQGLNIENPRTHSKASRGIEDVETLLKKEIAAEIKKTVEELLKEMRKGQKPRVVSKVGSGI
jgi:hypothetical protein